MSYTSVMIVEGILLDEKEWRSYVKTLWPRKVYDEMKELFRDPYNEFETFHEVWVGYSNMEDALTSGEYGSLESVDIQLEKINSKTKHARELHKIRDRIIEMSEKMNGLSWFTWPCDSDLTGKQFLLGKRIDSLGTNSNDAILNSVVEIPTSKIRQEDLPEMFQEKQIQMILMYMDRFD